jgi:hypothetical protein
VEDAPVQKEAAKLSEELNLKACGTCTNQMRRCGEPRKYPKRRRSSTGRTTGGWLNDLLRTSIGELTDRDGKLVNQLGWYPDRDDRPPEGPVQEANFSCLR